MIIVRSSAPKTQPHGFVRVADEYSNVMSIAWLASMSSVNLANRSEAVSHSMNGITQDVYAPLGEVLTATGSGSGKIELTPALPESESYTIVFVGATNGIAGGLDRLFSFYNGSGVGVMDMFYDVSRGWCFQLIRSVASDQWEFSSDLDTFSGCLAFSASMDDTVPGCALNGVVRSMNRFTTGSGSIVSPSPKFAVLGRPDVTTRQPPASVAAVFVLNVRLGLSALQELSLDPWQLLSTRRVFVPQAVAAPALPTLTAISASSITATGATLTITAS